MKALVVFDSVFGNTEKIAQAVGEGARAALGSQEEVEVLRVGQVQPQQWAGVGYLIVGSPTRAFQATPATKRFLKQIPNSALKGVKVAAFDTRILPGDTGSAVLRFFVKIFGYAAQPMANRLQQKGGQLVVPAEGFIVKGTEGPLQEGELERAAAWGRQIAAA